MSEGKLLIGLTFQPNVIREEQLREDGGRQTFRAALTFCHFPLPALFFFHGVEGGVGGGEARIVRGSGLGKAMSAPSEPSP